MRSFVRFFIYLFLFIFDFDLITSAATTETVESVGTQSQTVAHEDAYGTEVAVEEEDFSDLDMTGRIIAETYQIQSKLGAGSFGQVYLCEHLYTHEQWAMKIESHLMNNNPQLSIEVETKFSTMYTCDDCVC